MTSQNFNSFSDKNVFLEHSRLPPVKTSLSHFYQKDITFCGS